MYEPIKFIHHPPKPEIIMIDQEPLVLALDFSWLKSTVPALQKVAAKQTRQNEQGLQKALAETVER